MKRPFLMFAINDHMNDIGVRLSPAFARGVWLDLICLMAAGEPYGYLRWDTYSPETPPHQHPPQATPPTSTPPSTPPRRPPPSDEDTWTPSTGAPALPSNGSLETLLPYLTNTPAEVVEKALKILERNRVFERVKEGKLAGVIYSRRMKRDEENRQLKSKIAKEAQKKAQAKRGGAGAGARDPQEATPTSTPPTSTPPTAPPPGDPPLRTRTRTTVSTTTPPTPPSQGGTPGIREPIKKPARGRGQFDDAAIRRHAELMKGDKRK